MSLKLLNSRRRPAAIVGLIFALPAALAAGTIRFSEVSQQYQVRGYN